MNEPTAAAIAFAYEMKKINVDNIPKMILIFDFGGGTLDISIIEIDTDRKIKVINTNGDCNLGGQDVDNALIDHFIKTI